MSPDGNRIMVQKIDGEGFANAQPTIIDALAEIVVSSDCTTKLQSELMQVVGKRAKAFARSVLDLESIRGYSQRITVNTDVPVNTPQYNIPIAMRGRLRDKINEYVEAGIIQLSNSAWNSPIIPVSKKDGDIRLVLDSRGINAITEKVNYPLPRIENMLAELGGNGVFSVLDLESGYYQVELDENSRKYFAFRTPYGKYEFRRMPQGATNSSFHFQRIMQEVLGDLKSRGVIVFLDDVLIATKDHKDHLEVLDEVLARFEKFHIKVKLKKCNLYKQEVRYLGHLINKEGYFPDPKNISAIRDFKSPKTIKGVRSFLGLINFYSKFIPDLAQQALPLTELTKGKVKQITWNKAAEESFEILKRALIGEVMLRHPDMDKAFHLSLFVGTGTISAVLEQDHDEVLQPLGYYSYKLKKHERNYLNIEMQSLALVKALYHYDYLIGGRDIHLRSSHLPLEYLLGFRGTNTRVNKWALKIRRYASSFIMSPGNRNPAKILAQSEDVLINTVGGSNDAQVARAKSRVVVNDLSLDEILKSQGTDTELIDVIGRLKAGDEVRVGGRKNLRYEMDASNTVRVSGCVKVNRYVTLNLDAIYLPEELRTRAMAMYHNSKWSNHAGYVSTCKKLLHEYYWCDVKKDVEGYIKGCILCQKVSPKRDKAPIQEFEQSERPFGHVAMDVMGPLPKTNRGNVYLLNIIDLFSRYLITVAIPDQRAETIAEALEVHLISRHGCPSRLMSDRGSNFRSDLIKELCLLLGIKLHYTNPYRPFTNGAVERANRSVKEKLMHLCRNNGRKWDAKLHIAEFTYNNAEHSSIGRTPASVVFGRELQLPLPCQRNYRMPSVGNNVREYCERMVDDLKNTYEEVIRRDRNLRFKRNVAVNRKRKLIRYRVGEHVLYKMTDQNKRRNGKFSYSWDGPYVVLAAISEVTYFLRKPGSPDNEEPVRAHLDRIKRLIGDGADVHVVTRNRKGGGRKRLEKHREESDDEEDRYRMPIIHRCSRIHSPREAPKAALDGGDINLEDVGHSVRPSDVADHVEGERRVGQHGNTSEDSSAHFTRSKGTVEDGLWHKFVFTRGGHMIRKPDGEGLKVPGDNNDFDNG